MFKVEKSKGLKIKETKEKIAKAFSDLGAPVPDTMEEEKHISKLDEKLIHVGVSHLYMGVLENLNAAQNHLMKISKKTNGKNITVNTLIPYISSMQQAAVSAVDLIANNIEEMPTSKELKNLFAQLEEEAKNAALLQLMDTDIPKGKMH